jgi:Cupredoxin-like domain
MPRLRARNFAALVAAALLLASCGHTATVGASRTVRVELTEYRLHPQTIHASSGLLTLVIHNRGVLNHDLVVTQRGQTIDSTQSIQPGQTVNLWLNLAPGTYSMVSTIQSDQTLGEYGTLTVGS